MPTVSDFYIKPSKVGKKPNQRERKRPNRYPFIVEERIDLSQGKAVTPLVVKKGKDGEYECSKVAASDITRVDPKRKSERKAMELRLRSKHKMVTRYMHTFSNFSEKQVISGAKLA